jgi:hypothetical protein
MFALVCTNQPGKGVRNLLLLVSSGGPHWSYCRGNSILSDAGKDAPNSGTENADSP